MKIQLDRDNFFVKILPQPKKEEEKTESGIYMPQSTTGSVRQYQIAEILQTSDEEKYPIGTHVILGNDKPDPFRIVAENFKSEEYIEVPLSRIRGRILEWR